MDDASASPSPAPPAYRRVVAALAASEERYRVLVEGVRRYAIFMLNPAGIILTWNQGVEELLGYRREEFVGHPGSICLIPSDRAGGLFDQELDEARRTGETSVNRRARHKDGRHFAVNESATALRDAAGRLIGFAKVMQQVDAAGGSAAAGDAPPGPVQAELARTLALLHGEVEERRRLEAAMLTAVEEERERLGRDLHDDLLQRLAAINMMVWACVKDFQDKGSAQEATQVEQLVDHLTDAVQSARSLAHGLYPATLAAQGLPGALEELAERIPLDVEFHRPQTERLDLEPTVALHAYRIAEEAVGNALRHSGAQRITIALGAEGASPAETAGGRVVLSIRDDGCGFEVGQSAPTGMGMGNMKYRAGMIGGSLSIHSEPGKGTCVSCTVPLSKAEGLRK